MYSVYSVQGLESLEYVFYSCRIAGKPWQGFASTPRKPEPVSLRTRSTFKANCGAFVSRESKGRLGSAFGISRKLFFRGRIGGELDSELINAGNSEL